MPLIKKKTPTFPNIESWDDFLDFSRWRVPAKSVITKRLLENSVVYSGNYVWMWATVTMTYGLFLNWRIMTSFLTIAGVWRVASLLYKNVCLLEARDGRIGGSKRPENDFSLPPSSKGWLLLFAVFVMYQLSVLLEILLALLGTIFFAGGHAVARPVVNEYYIIHQENQTKVQQKRPPTTQRQGNGLDPLFEEQEVEEVTFMPDENSTVRNRAVTVDKCHSS